MNRKVFYLTAAVLFVGACLGRLAFAQEMEKVAHKGMMHKGMMHAEEMEGHGTMGRCPMGGMMMKEMMQKTVVPTSDGGVIVLAGCTLMKFDKNLNLVKEVQIKMDMDAMQKNMEAMMKNCPMMKRGMMKDDEEDMDEDDAASNAKPAETK